MRALDRFGRKKLCCAALNRIEGGTRPRSSARLSLLGSPPLPNRPAWMQLVDHENVTCPPARMPFEKMGMIEWQIVMPVRYHLDILFGPDSERDHRADQRQGGGGSEGDSHTFERADLPGERIGDEPANMAERELSSEQGGSIFLRR